MKILDGVGTVFTQTPPLATFVDKLEDVIVELKRLSAEASLSGSWTS